MAVIKAFMSFPDWKAFGFQYSFCAFSETARSPLGLGLRSPAVARQTEEGRLWGSTDLPLIYCTPTSFPPTFPHPSYWSIHCSQHAARKKTTTTSWGECPFLYSRSSLLFGFYRCKHLCYDILDQTPTCLLPGSINRISVEYWCTYTIREIPFQIIKEGKGKKI